MGLDILCPMGIGGDHVLEEREGLFRHGSGEGGDDNGYGGIHADFIPRSVRLRIFLRSVHL